MIDDRTAGSCRLIASRATRRIFSAHIVGEHALAVIQLVVATLAVEMWVEHLAEPGWPIPAARPSSASPRDLVRQLGVMRLPAAWNARGTTHVSEWEHGHGWRNRR